MRSPRRRALMVHSVGQIAMGVSYIVFPTKGRNQGLAWMPEIVTPQLFGIVPLVIGLIVFTMAIRSTTARTQTRAFVIAGIPWGLLAGTFLMAQVLGTHPQGIASAIGYAVLTGALVNSSLTADPSPRTMRDILDDAQRGSHE